MRLRQRPYWQRLLITAIAYGVVMVVDGVFTRGAVPPPSWFDAGVALAAVLLMGWEVLPVFFFMTLAGVLYDSWPLPVILTATAAVTIEPALGAWLLKRAKFRPTFESVRDIWLFISLGVVVGTMPAMLTGVVAVTIGWGAPYGPVLSLLSWWMADAVGVLTVTPFLLVLVSRPTSPSASSRPDTLERVGIAVCAAVVSLVPLTPIGATVSWVMPYAVIPLLIWCAVRFDLRGATGAVLSVGLIVTLETALGYGAYAPGTASGGYIQMQVFLLTVAATTLTLGTAAAANHRAELERAAAQARYRALVEGIPAVTYEAGANAAIDHEYVSPRIEEVLGYTPEEWYAGSGNWLEKLIHPDDRERLLVAMEASDRTGKLAVEYRIKDKSGEYRWVSDRAVRTVNESGEDVFTGSFSDETEIRVAEKARRDAEEHLRLVLESTHDVIMRIGPGFDVMYASPSVRAVMGASPSDIQDIVSEMTARADPMDEHFSQLRRAVDGVIESGEPVEIEVAFPTEHGVSYYTALLTPDPDPDGSVRSVVLVARDINERRKSEEALRESEARFRAIVQNTTDVIVRFDAHGRFSYVNPAASETMGVAPEQMLGKTPAEIGIPEDIATRWTEGILDVLATGKSLANDYVLPLPGGTRTFSSITTRDFSSGGGPTATVISRDMTARRDRERAIAEQRDALERLVEERTVELQTANEQLLELDRLKSMFIASMSHELRTPLNSVIGFSGVLLAGIPGPLNDEQRAQLEMVNAAGEHLLAIIGDILDVSQIEAGAVKPAVSEFELGSVQMEALQLLSGEAQAKGLELEADACDIVMVSDRRRVLQCVVNLLSNAVKYTDHGSVRLWSRRTDGKVEIAVTDTGTGIEGPDRPRIFAPFTRLEYERHADKPGTGLGLYLTRKVAGEVLGGDVDVTSNPGTGSTFTLTLPVVLLEVVEPAAGTPARGVRGGDSTSARGSH